MARMPLPNQRRHAREAPASASAAAASTVLEVDGLQLHVTRKRIKNLYLRIKPPLGTVEVSAPMRMSQRQIIGFAHERHSWIVQQQRRMAEARRMSLRQAETLTPLPSAPAGDGGHAGVDGRRGGDQPQLPMFDRSAMWTDERKHAAAAAIDAALPVAQVGAHRRAFAEPCHLAGHDVALGVMHAENRAYPAESSAWSDGASIFGVRSRP